MDARVRQFHQEALEGLNKNTPKQISTLRRFLHRNQDHRFEEGEKNRLFNAVQTFYQLYDADKPRQQELVLPLVEDCLKMPYNVFSSKHKKTFLKMYSATSGSDFDESFLSEPTSSASSTVLKAQVIDVDLKNKVFVVVIDESSGSTEDIPIPSSPSFSSSLSNISQLFEAGSCVYLSLDPSSHSVIGFTCDEES